MSKHAIGALLLPAALLYGCATQPKGEVPPLQSNALLSPSTTSGVVHGNFTEYSLPAGADPVIFSKGPYSTLWFATNNGNFGNGYDVYRFSEGTGAVSTFSMGPPWSAVNNIVTTNSKMYFIALNTAGPGENPEYITYAMNSGAIVTGSAVASDEQIGPTVLGPDGNLWFPDCVQACSENPGNSVRSITPSGASGVWVSLTNFTANNLTPGPLGDMYVTASYSTYYPPPTPQHDSAVFVLSTSGTILHEIFLPHGSNPSGIATGSDHNLWITEPGINKIARMTPSGSITGQFIIPTANSGAAWITQGADGQLWFTETTANKIGRLTTTGGFRQWTIPTANSRPTSIQYCYPGCGAHYGVWFAETGANQIG